MKYIFPRQFGLHNVFTSSVDSKETAHPFKDYTLREQEIASVERRPELTGESHHVYPLRLPKRLRGPLPMLIARMLKLHSTCSYVELLKYYCPVEPLDKAGAVRPQEPKVSTEVVLKEGKMVNKNVTDLATPIHSVSAFCRAALARIIPRTLLGQSSPGRKNFERLMQVVDSFIASRKYESITLHAVCQHLNISCIAWLAPKSGPTTSKMSLSDFNKRKEILYEFVYYIFDSILIPLLRCTFHVTESNSDKNRLFFFRHDIWKALTEPYLANLKLTMFQDSGARRSGRVSEANALSFSQMRLVPKGTSFRPIMNLRRRALTVRNGKMVLDRAINFQLRPVHSMLNHEKIQQPNALGASLFSVGDIHGRLKAFRSALQRTGRSNSPLFFAKVDVKACFDTIPQRDIVHTIERLCSADKYRVNRHAEVKACNSHGHRREAVTYASKPSRKFLMTASANTDRSFVDDVNSRLAREKKNTVFVESGSSAVESKHKLMQLLMEHVRHNRVKIGKKYYRQKQGIPQGSILSSIMCSFFYGNFELSRLDFLDDTDCLLLRLIDDFLLITTDRRKASQFLRTMHRGDEAYGISVRPEKSLANFACRLDGLDVPRLEGTAAFPYCGTIIDTRSLEISRDRLRQQKSGKERSPVTLNSRLIW